MFNKFTFARLFSSFADTEPIFSRPY